MTRKYDRWLTGIPWAVKIAVPYAGVNTGFLFPYPYSPAHPSLLARGFFCAVL
jgi:hypothetical protein